MMKKCVGVLAAVALAPTVAMAQWTENFDSYAAGTVLDNVGGWAGWDNTGAAALTVSSDFSQSPANSGMVGPGTDAIYAFSGYDSGSWTFTASQYIPRDFTGATYAIFQNIYNHGGPYDWSVQLKFDAATGLVTDDNHAGSTVSFVRGEWATIRLEIDLDADTVSSYYNNQLIAGGTWTSSGASATSIGALDLFGNNASPVYYDNLSLIPAPGAVALLGMAGLVAGRRRR